MSFENLQNSDPDSTPNTPADPQGNQAFLVVGERAFQTANDVATKIANADTHISKIEDENAGLREQLAALQAKLDANDTAANSADTILAKLEQLQSAGNADTTNAVSKEDLEAVQAKAVQEALSQVNALASAAKQKENLNSCLTKAKESYGDTVSDNIKQIASGLSMSLADVDTMAKNQPAIFEKLFLPTKSSNPQPSGGGVQSGRVTDPSAPKVQRPEKSIMNGATTKDIMGMWNYCNPDNYEKG